MDILLSNDDGIYAAGFRSLYAALLAAGHRVRAIAPATEKSGASCAINTHIPLQMQEVHEPDFDGYALEGNPADCVLFGLNGLFEEGYRPDVVMSGINRGPNAGYDVLYSGTVGAAVQAALVGIPAVAVSSLRMRSANRKQAAEAVSIMERIDFSGVSPYRVYNLNFPDREMEDVLGLKVCPVSTVWDGFKRYEERHAPSGRPYWWMGSLADHFTADAPGMDKGWLKRGYMTLTPLRYELSDYETMEKLRYLEKDRAGR